MDYIGINKIKIILRVLSLADEIYNICALNYNIFGLSLRWLLLLNARGQSCAGALEKFLMKFIHRPNKENSARFSVVCAAARA